MAATKEKELEIPQLEKGERLELQNIMLRMALEQERIGALKLQIQSCQRELEYQESRLKVWQSGFSGKLKKHDLSIEQLDIDAETGKVSISNVKNLPRGK